jgi:hypothetical protein
MQFFFNTLIGRQKMAQKKGSGYMLTKLSSLESTILY